MADLTGSEQSEFVKITNEEENNIVSVTGQGELETSDLIKVSGVQGALSVGTSAVEVRVGASRLANRKSVTVYNFSNRTIYWGYNNSVTTSTGTPILRDEFSVFRASDQVSIFLIAEDPNLDIRITEAY